MDLANKVLNFYLQIQKRRVSLAVETASAISQFPKAANVAVVCLNSIRWCRAVMKLYMQTKVQINTVPKYFFPKLSISIFACKMVLSTKSTGIVFLSSLLLCRSVLGWTCFFPAGDVASTYIPCSSNNDGNCCVEGDLCTSIGYCLSNTHAFYYRGACTDQAWGNPSCPDYCLADENCESTPLWPKSTADILF
jgi:hypothetical protein